MYVYPTKLLLLKTSMICFWTKFLPEFTKLLRIQKPMTTAMTVCYAAQLQRSHISVGTAHKCTFSEPHTANANTYLLFTAEASSGANSNWPSTSFLYNLVINVGLRFSQMLLNNFFILQFYHPLLIEANVFWYN